MKASAVWGSEKETREQEVGQATKEKNQLRKSHPPGGCGGIYTQTATTHIPAQAETRHNGSCGALME